MTSRLDFPIFVGVNPIAEPSYSVTLKRSRRRRSVAIQIFPDGRVVVSAPLRVSEEKVHQFLTEKKAWIERTLRKFADQGPRRAKLNFQAGELLQYLGQEKTLRVHRSGRRLPELRESDLHVFLPVQTPPEREATEIRGILEKWYRDQAVQLCLWRVDHYSRIMGLTPRSVHVRNYKTRWGTCRSTGEITFNWRLAMAPLELLDSIVVHELAHLRHPNHGAKFWALVRAYFPDPKKAKIALENLDHRGFLTL